MSHLQIQDASIFYEIQGSGPPLILISGYTCDHMLWEHLMEKLTPHFQVIRFDNRGVGRTKDSAKLLSAELLASDLHGMIQALGLHKPHIIGQSMGGTIAQVFAANYPQEIGKLILLVSSARWRKAMLMALESHLNLKKQGMDSHTLFETILPWIFGEKFLSDPSNIETIEQYEFDDPYPQSAEDTERQFAILKSFDGRKGLQKIQAPTLVMHGMEDLLSLPSESEYLARNIRGARLEAFETGHGLILEAPDLFIASVLSFLK